MRSHHCRLFLLTLCCFILTGPSFTIASTDAEVWQCPGPDGTPLFTNKERAGCQVMELKPLSITSSLPEMSDHLNAPSAADAFSYDTPAGALRNSVPDWGREWQANNTLAGSIQGEVCSMYGEWLRLNEKSRGGVFFGTDPSYGADPTARNFRAPSFSFYDNARWVTLSRMFGTGFVPIGCP